MNAHSLPNLTLEDYFAEVERLIDRLADNSRENITADIASLRTVNRELAETFDIEQCAGCRRWKQQYEFTSGECHCNACVDRAERDHQDEQDTIRLVRSR